MGKTTGVPDDNILTTDRFAGDEAIDIGLLSGLAATARSFGPEMNQ